MGTRASLDGSGKSRPQRDSIPRPPSPQQVAIPTELSYLTETNASSYTILILLDSDHLAADKVLAETLGKLMWPPNHSKELIFPTSVKSQSVRDRNKETQGASDLTMEVQNHIPTTPDNLNTVTFIHLFGFSHLFKFSVMNCLPKPHFWFSLVHSVTNNMKSFIFPTPKRQLLTATANQEKYCIKNICTQPLNNVHVLM